MREVVRIIQRVWHWLEHLHTAVWVFTTIGGIGIASIFHFSLRTDTGTIFSGMVSLAVFILGASLTVRHYLRRNVDLTILDVKLEPKKELELRRTMRVVLRNDSKEIVIAQAPRWEGLYPTVSRSYPEWSCVQLESQYGPGYQLDDWGAEQKEIIVRPPKTFRASIGLDWSLSDEDFRRRRLRQQVGTLVLPLNVAGQHVRRRIDL